MAASSGITPAWAGQFQSKRAGELANRQFGAIARRQLTNLGFTSSRIEHWIGSGRLHPQHPGVYAYGRPDLGTEGELSAALLYANHGAALAGLSALWWRNLLGRRPTQIHIDAPGHAASRPGIRVRHPRQVAREWHRGLPVVPLPTALLAASTDLSHNSLRLVVARAEFHRLLHLPSLHAALGAGRPGSTAVRAAMAAHLPQLAACESPLEIDFVLLCESFGVPIPEPNVRIGRWRPDMLWRCANLIVELDGHDAHHTAAQVEADERKAEALRRRGFEVIRFDWEQVHLRAAAVAANLTTRLG